ncbi:XRE family transcriptional regulator [Fusobacterium necrophorum]|uniref:XRE family transcriptional regulator n=1 Tax=Fusobacterium necrophorum TaxID=859 RepID=A0A4Q2KXW6_9FUSO|nr:helix-turn-helix transcriptional regulator [Fusobacterium necrophorum]RXZ69817.1 XRE family transcriptional regulator [Fusobacterium necrophorum]
MTIGEKLTLLRGNKSQKTVAESIGITVTALWNYENDYRVPKDEIKKKISIYYNKTVDEIFFTE